MKKNTLDVTTKDGTFGAYIDDASGTHHPVVIVLQEIFGVNEGIKKIARDVASQGFVVVCPDLFWREQPWIQLSDHDAKDVERAMSIYTALDVDRTVDDVLATIDAARPLSSTGKVGVMGFCLGGLLTFLGAARGNVDAGAAYYGGATEKYVSEMGHIQGDLIMHLGGGDEYISDDAQRSIREAASHFSNITVYDYPERRHAFARPGGDSYDAKDAAMAHAHTYALFQRRLAVA